MIRKDVEEFQMLLLNVYEDISKAKNNVFDSKSDNGLEVDKAQLCSLTCQIANVSNFLPFSTLIELRASAIHGVGVFATCNIPKFCMVTFYPGDIAECTPKQRSNIGKVRTCSTFSKRFQEKYDGAERQQRFEKLRTNGNYTLQVDSKNTIIADPCFDNNVCYFGHFVNDRFKPDGNKITDEVYHKLSTSRSNCAYYKFNAGLHIGILTTRNIAKNEELFVTYGACFWNLQTTS